MSHREREATSTASSPPRAATAAKAKPAASDAPRVASVATRNAGTAALHAKVSAMKARTAARALRREERKKALSLDASAQATPTHQSQEPPQPSPQASAPEPQEGTTDAAGSARGNPSQPSFERLAPTKPEPRAAPCPATPDSGQGGTQAECGHPRHDKDDAQPAAR